MADPKDVDRAQGGTFDAGLYAGAHVVVAGGTSGIGAAIASAFARHGATVVATGATSDDVDAAQVMPGLAHERLDVADGTAIEAFIAAQPRIDVLVNCAGITRRGGQEHELDTFIQVVDVNLTGTMRMCAAARAALKQSGGAIINTASMLSFLGGALVPAYAASKGGVAQLTKSLAIAYAADGIRVNAVAPGYIATRLTGALQADDTRNDAILARTPMGRWGQPDDIAGAALFLASPAARFVTGVVLPVDGGYLVS
ncbi:NAD(P)-dependent dehydrogenase, short-chain alcohol dehydrogenase family [Cupriavidus sp. YR651]|uniref:SDR family NAD(P)-dependent oxidoreductase n=1 Tax=Cupriavidus sp. YR651 TaxID=1855315 RepID=UPI000881A10C|nr:SDR family oxidoreductase [Cupriavidus sp. YR651]SDD56514.1 NAD(P)-dependent dehydrogenase, short-chain alcohol dehydrogenase family [Cupriavidus sp. YR651]